MKRFNQIILLLFTVISLGSCGFHNAHSLNVQNNSTNVELSKKNFKVIGQVKGSASHTYVIGFGGLEKRALLDEAKRQLYENAKLEGTSKAIINTTVEYHTMFITELYVKRTVTVSGWVIEFTE